MPRIPYINKETAGPEVRKLYAKLLGPLKIIDMMANAENIVGPAVRLSVDVVARQKLDPKLREMAILLAVALEGGAYPWNQHEAMARVAGTTPAQLDALKRGDVEFAEFTELERRVLRFTREAVENAGAGEATATSLSEFLSPQEIIEIMIAIGFYMMVTRISRTADLDLDTPPAEEQIRELYARGRGKPAQATA